MEDFKDSGRVDSTNKSLVTTEVKSVLGSATVPFLCRSASN